MAVQPVLPSDTIAILWAPDVGTFIVVAGNATVAQSFRGKIFDASKAAFDSFRSDCAQPAVAGGARDRNDYHSRAAYLSRIAQCWSMLWTGCQVALACFTGSAAGVLLCGPQEDYSFQICGILCRCKRQKLPHI